MFADRCKTKQGISSVAVIAIIVVIIVIVAGASAYMLLQAPKSSSSSSSSSTTTTSTFTTSSGSSTTITTIASSNSSSSLKIAYIASGPCNDLGYYQGGCVAVKNMSSFATIGIADSVADADYTSVAQQFVNQGYNIIFGQGFEAIGPFSQLAPKYPNTLFACACLPPLNSNSSNFIYYYADNSGAAYLGGVLAAYLTKTNHLGFISGLGIPAVWAYENGFRLGAWSVNKSIQISSVFTQDFNDPSKAFQAASGLVQQGVDFIYVGESPGGTGAYQEASQAHIYAMGNEFDQNSLANQTIVTSAVAIWYPVMHQIVVDYQNHSWKSGYVCGIRQGCADIASFHGLVPSSLVTKVMGVRQGILNGTITVPLIDDHEVTSPP
ncbi:MAG TPA: BMP family protein [Nitrososphaerales archaeon]|nr:BMP family protein [Nitrososphaerales archaeon]